MYVIDAQGVNEAWEVAVGLSDALAKDPANRRETRAGPAVVAPSPVATCYAKPTQRVLLDPVRDAPVFFHFFESLWLLAGRDDAKWLDQFVGDFSSRYAQDDGKLHGSYGKRWRDHFLREDSHGLYTFDQLDEVVRLLQANPEDRQAVIQMWDPSSDLGVTGLKDRPCNQSVMLRADRGVLDITVPCRSNDIVWGCYGANAVQFSMLQEYLAARIGIPVGTYLQLSHNWHRYEHTAPLCDHASAQATAALPYPGTLPLVEDPDSFDEELAQFLDDPEAQHTYRNGFFSGTAQPMFLANAFRREKRYEHAAVRASQVAAPDWRAGAVDWLQRRVK